MPIRTKKGCFYKMILKVSRKPFQFYSYKILIKSKNKGFCYSSSFCPFFLGLGGAFFFFAPSFFFSYSNRFSSYFFLIKYSSSYFNFSSQFYFNFKFHFNNIFLPSKGYYFTVFNR